MGKNDLLPGTLDMMVLKALTRGALHGYAIAQLLRQLSEDILQVEEGSLYPALQRLELNGWIEGEWGVSSNNRRARFYRLTADGRKKLASRQGRHRGRDGARVIRRLQRRLRYWLHRAERARLLREEMETHLEMKTRELMGDGMTESDARGAARRQFGNPTLKQEEARGTWIARWLSDLAQDSVFAVRTVRKQPGFAAFAILSAALGIGSCSMLFGIANFALFRPLPVDHPSNLASISGKDLRRGKAGVSIAFPDFEDLRQARAFQGVTAFFQFMPATISSNGEPQRYWGSMVTANYFDVVRPAFAAGRGFDAAKDDKKGEAPVVVLSYQLWRSRFGSDGAIVGRSIELNRRKVTVVGVAGPGFRGTELMFYSDFWLPFSMLDSLAEAGMGGDRLHDRGSQWLAAAGRLRDGVSEKAAASEIEVIGKRLGTAYPATNKDRAFHVERAGQINPGVRKMIVVFFLMLLGVAALVQGTACANVANLLLARASARRKEIAIRLAIGAGRGRLVRQLLTESVMLALLGGIERRRERPIPSCRPP